MKTPPLLFSLPLLLTTLAAHSLPSDPSKVSQEPSTSTSETAAEFSAKLPLATQSTAEISAQPLIGPGGQEMWPTAEGLMMRLPIRGSMRLVHVMTNQFHAMLADGSQKVMTLADTIDLAGLTREMAQSAISNGGEAELVAYDPDMPRTDGGKMLITSRIAVVLVEGMSFSAFANNSGALGAMRPGFAPECLILNYASGMDAIGAAAELSRKPGVAHVEHIVAVRRTPEYIPTEPLFMRGTTLYGPLPMTDNVEGWQCTPWLCNIIGPPPLAYQWWGNNRKEPGFPAPLNSVVRARVDLGDYPPIEYVPSLPAVHGEQADIRLPVAWEHPPGGASTQPRISGYRIPVLLVDDGIQNKPVPAGHRDLQLAFESNIYSKNYVQPRVGPFEFPKTATRFTAYSNNTGPDDSTVETHGTSLAGIIGARHDNTGYGIAGIAPGCLFQAAVAVKGGFLPDDAWADAFALGSSLEDTSPIPPDNSLLDETRNGSMRFRVCLSAIGFLGAQDAVNLYPESWLWKRAVRHGATQGNNFKGIPYVTSAGNGGEGHMDVNYTELKNSIYMIPVAGISELGRRIFYSNKGSAVVCAAPTGGRELPPLLSWDSAPPANLWGTRPFRKNPPIEVDDVPYNFRRENQGIPTIATTDHVQTPNFNLNFNGTSASAAMATGIVALMLEANPDLGARDVKEILLRSGRVCNDCRVTWDGGIWPDLKYTAAGILNVVDSEKERAKYPWRMSRTGNPMSYAFGAGLVDANLALQIATNWKPLPSNPYQARQLDVTAPDFAKKGTSQRNTETGGIYYQVSAQNPIPINASGNIPALEYLVPGPPAGLRVEHVEVRVRFYHQRRGDVEIKLIAPPEAGWETGVAMESDLYVPHREDYVESRWDDDTVALRNPTDWTFTTVRHWGTRIPVTTSGLWKVRIIDAVSRGKTDPPTVSDPVFVPKDNPTDPSKQRLEGIGITYHGIVEKTPANDPPVVLTRSTKIRFAPRTEVSQAQLAVEPLALTPQGAVRFPLTNWDLFNPVDIVPFQPTNTPREFFEFFPPLRRDQNDPNILIPLDDPLTAIDEWPNQPLSPVWVPWLFPPAPTSGPLGGLTSQPAWGPVENGQRTPVEMTADNQFIVVHEIDRKTKLEKPNAIHVRLNRLTGQLDIVPRELGNYKILAYAENLLGMSQPKPLEITVSLPNFRDWADTYWDLPELNDPAISGWSADPDGDRLVNGLEFAMRLDPTVPQPADDPVPAWRIEGNEVIFTYRRDITVTGVTLHAQVSEDLLSWNDVNPPPTILGESNGLQDLEVRISLTDDKTFFRLFAEDTTGPPGP